jgi:hypothetical protein
MFKVILLLAVIAMVAAVLAALKLKAARGVRGGVFRMLFCRRPPRKRRRSTSQVFRLTPRERLPSAQMSFYRRGNGDVAEGS